MGDQVNGWNLTEAEWKALVDAAGKSLDVLEDGAFVRAAQSAEGGTELRFYATALNKPEGWRHAFNEQIPRITRRVASIGRARHDVATGFVEFDVEVEAAAQALIADYEGGAGDFNDFAIEDEIDRALLGTPADRAWLIQEFDRLTKMAK